MTEPDLDPILAFCSCFKYGSPHEDATAAFSSPTTPILNIIVLVITSGISLPKSTDKTLKPIPSLLSTPTANISHSVASLLRSIISLVVPHWAGLLQARSSIRMRFKKGRSMDLATQPHFATGHHRGGSIPDINTATLKYPNGRA